MQITFLSRKCGVAFHYGVVSEETNKPMPNLYLVGFMGVGKSAVGRKVARELRYRFLDSDHQIEKKAGKMIPAIFAEDGEAAFRQMEREFIESGHSDQGCVVSCGGGLVVEEGMSDLLKEKGVVVCLFASAETVIERTSRNANRPLLNVDHPEERVRQLLAEREPIYMNAGACITTEGRTMTEVVRHVVRTYMGAARVFGDRAE
jgi:shikimate kinase